MKGVKQFDAMPSMFAPPGTATVWINVKEADGGCETNQTLHSELSIFQRGPAGACGGLQ